MVILPLPLPLPTPSSLTNANSVDTEIRCHRIVSNDVNDSNEFPQHFFMKHWEIINGVVT